MIPLDIDFVTYDENTKQYSIIEVKEKDVAKTFNGFGLDERRINSLEILVTKMRIPAYIVIREVNNQVERSLVDWKYISFDDFKKHADFESLLEGEEGLGGDDNYLCAMCEYKYFKSFSRRRLRCIY